MTQCDSRGEDQLHIVIEVNLFGQIWLISIHISSVGIACTVVVEIGELKDAVSLVQNFTMTLVPHVLLE